MTAVASLAQAAGLRPRQAAKIEVDGTGCWRWHGCTTSSGYAVITRGPRGQSVQIPVHRLMYEAATGSAIPDGLVIDHLCRVRHCVNPSHMEAVTVRENTIRGLAPSLLSAYYKAQTHCRNGHLWTPENTKMERGCRRCRTCEAGCIQRRLGGVA